MNYKKFRILRKQLKLTQADVAVKIGLSVRQIQKYELGKSQISVERLKEFAMVYNVEPTFFIDSILKEDKVPYNVEEEEIVTLNKIFAEIKNKELRKKALALLKIIAQEEEKIIR